MVYINEIDTYIKNWTEDELFVARSISEEFSSGDSRYRDNEENIHSRDRKDKEDRDEGIVSFYQLLKGLLSSW